jgi:hypothetical protein
LLQSTRDSDLYLAWIYCLQKEEAVCIVLKKIGQSRFARVHASWLVTVTTKQLREFKPEEIYLLTTSQETNHGDLHPTKSWGRVKLNLPEVETNISISVDAAFPFNRWSMDELFFDEDSELIGAIRLDCHSDGPQCPLFVVVFGHRGRQPWCIIRLDPSRSDLAETCQWAMKQSHTDRAVITTPSKVKVQYRATIRPGSSLSANIAVFSLTVTAFCLPDH